MSSASPLEAEWLGINAGSPTIRATYRDPGRLADGELAPLEFARMVYRSDITSFTSTSARRSRAPALAPPGAGARPAGPPGGVVLAS